MHLDRGRQRYLAACLAVLPSVVIATPVDSGRQQLVLQGTDATKRLHGKFLHITDLHPDQFYKPHTSTDDEVACHRHKGPSGYYGAETSDCDSPYALVNATFDWISENLRDQVDFVVWTGDTARHDSDEKIPRSSDQVLNTNDWVAGKFLDVFADPDSRKLSVPVIPTLGNNDFLPHNIFMPGPNKWLRSYHKIWRRFIPEEQDHAFQFGGWFFVEVVPDRLAVFSLNTMYFFDRNAAVDGCEDKKEPGFKHMEWLRVQLQGMRDRGMKAILIGHVPPARTDSKQNWDETCWQKYNLWMKQYRDVVVGSMYGHMNIDHFLVHDTHEVDIRSDPGAGVERAAFEDELSAQSKEDYLQELRQHWSKLPKSLVGKSDADATGGKKKKKHWAERYHLSLISPSVVPNYFPTLRVIEYNITGLEDAPVWQDAYSPHDQAEARLPLEAPEDDDARLDLKRDVGADTTGKKHKKPKKPKKPKDPNLHVPEGPSKSSPPGPAYSAQPLTFTGYTQYFANLTRLNNDVTDDSDLESSRWRSGVHKDKDFDGKPDPLPFEFEVEYSTFDDKVFKLADLTVQSYIKLAYRMAQRHGSGKSLDEGLEDDFEEDTEDDEEAGPEDDVDAEGKKHKKKKRNKVWLEFLSRAFVKTVPRKELKKLSN